MFGPGAYVPDPTEGLVEVKDLPVPKLLADDRHHKPPPCPRCGHLASRHKADQRTLHDRIDTRVVPWISWGPPRRPPVPHAGSIAPSIGPMWPPPGSHSTHRVIDMAVRVVVEERVPARPASGPLWRDHRVLVPWATLQNGVAAGGKKGARAPGRRIAGVGA